MSDLERRPSLDSVDGARRRERSPPRESSRPQLDEFGRAARASFDSRPRSPNFEDRSRMKRRRSPSPMGPPGRYEGDRYGALPPPPDPYHRSYRDDYPPEPMRGDRRNMPPPRGYPPPSRRARRPAPEDVPYLVTYQHFADHIEDHFPAVYNDRKQLEQAWQNYRSQYFKKLNKTFFQDHQAKPWFVEKYDPAFATERAALRAKGREGRIDLFLNSLTSGDLDELTLEWPAAKKFGAEEVKSAPKEENGSEAPADGDAGAAGKADRDDLCQIQAPANEFVIKSIPPDMQRAALIEHLEKAPGFDYLIISDPNPTKRLQRVAFAVFKPDADMEQAEQLLFESKIGEFTLHMNRTKQSQNRVKFSYHFRSEPERAAKDLDQAQRLLQVLEAEAGDTRVSNAVAQRMSVKEEADRASGMQTDQQQSDTIRYHLDLTVEALRQAFNTCYYCHLICDYPEELSRRCVKHVRKPAGGRPPARKDLNDMEAFDEKVAFLVQPEQINPHEFGLDDYAAILSLQTRDQVKEEEEGAKFRCIACQKLFKARNFIEKHLLNKHPDLLDVEPLQKVQYFNNYMLDPNRVIPEPPEPGSDRRPPPPPPVHMGGSSSVHTGPMNGSRPLSDRISNRLGDRFSDRIGDRPYHDQPSKRPRREPLEIPKGVQVEDPRASKMTSYKDLDSAFSAPSGDLELNY